MSSSSPSFCVHCKEPIDEHVAAGGEMKCLWQPTTWEMAGCVACKKAVGAWYANDPDFAIEYKGTVYYLHIDCYGHLATRPGEPAPAHRAECHARIRRIFEKEFNL